MKCSFIHYACIAVVAMMSAHPVVVGYCDTAALSKRDCEICKVGNSTQADCDSTGNRAPCFWKNSSDVNPYENWTDADCDNGDGGDVGGPPSGGCQVGGTCLGNCAVCCYGYDNNQGTKTCKSS